MCAKDSHNLQNLRIVDHNVMDYSKCPRLSNDSSSDEEKKLGKRRRTKIVEAFKRPKPSFNMLKKPHETPYSFESLPYQVPKDEPYGLPWFNINPSAKHYNMRIKRFDTKLDATLFVSLGFACCLVQIENNFNLISLAKETGSPQINS